MILYSAKFPCVKFFVVLQILMCEPYKFPYSRVLFFKTAKSTKNFTHENITLYGIIILNQISHPKIEVLVLFFFFNPKGTIVFTSVIFIDLSINQILSDCFLYSPFPSGNSLAD